MKCIVKEKLWIDCYGRKRYTYEKVLVSDDEYYTRKYSETTPHESMDKIFETYRDYVDSMRWD